MKKCVLVLFILLLLMIPVNVGATNNEDVAIEYTQIDGMTVKTVGEELSLSFLVKVSGIQKGNSDSLGILTVVYELIFDDEVFTVTGVSSPNWDSGVYKEDGKYYVISTVSDSNASRNKCVDEISYCADYLVSVNFFVNDTDKTSSTIKMGEVAVGLIGMLDQNKKYSEEDVVTLTDVSDQSRTITINKAQEPVEEQPSSIVSDSKPKIDNEDIINKSQKNSSSVVKKSDNNYLEDLYIKNYEIDFDKTKNNYEITVEQGVNELEIEVVLEDSKSTYKVIGADDLENNYHRVLIEVYAEDGEKNTYIIDVKKEGLEVVVDDVDGDTDSKTLENNKFELSDEHLVIIGVVIGVIFLLFVISKLRDRKLEKALDNL